MSSLQIFAENFYIRLFIGNLNVSQINQLKAQVHAYRLLARNQPLPAGLSAVAFGQSSEGNRLL